MDFVTVSFLGIGLKLSNIMTWVFMGRIQVWLWQGGAQAVNA
jgi:hypothetical protein